MKEAKGRHCKTKPLVDRFSRTISYLRLSLTDRCNLRCHYCMPCDNTDQQGSGKSLQTLDANELLSYEELLRIVTIAVGLGMKKLRLTGGEPLIRRGVMGFIHQLSLINGLEQIRLTTNGVLLEDNAEELYSRGVRHLNISLDTLIPERFAKITGKNHFHRVIRGIDKALQIGFRIKLNIVAMRDINHDEFIDFAKYAFTHPLQVRFIEFMPVGKGSIWKKDHYIPSEEIQEMLSAIGTLTPLKTGSFDGPARMFSLHDTHGRKARIGFISPISHHFCDQCNRLRLTSEGKLRACLLQDSESDLKDIIRSGCGDNDIEEAIRNAILLKPQGHGIADGKEDGVRLACRVPMSRIGG